MARTALARAAGAARRVSRHPASDGHAAGSDVLTSARSRSAGGSAMTRRYFSFLLSGSAAWLLCARGHAVSQAIAKVPHIGVLVSASEPHPFADAVRHGLQI